MRQRKGGTCSLTSNNGLSSLAPGSSHPQVGPPAVVSASREPLPDQEGDLKICGECWIFPSFYVKLCLRDLGVFVDLKAFRFCERPGILVEHSFWLFGSSGYSKEQPPKRFAVERCNSPLSGWRAPGYQKFGRPITFM